MKVTVQAKGLDAWEAVIEGAGEEIVPEGEKLVGKGSNNIKKDARQRVSGHPKLTHYPYTINYDVTTTGTLIDGEIGPDLDKGGQAPLGGFAELEYGTPWSAPVPHLAPALEAEAPRFTKAVEDLGAKLLEGR